MNELAFFLQFLIAFEDRHKFFFITYRDKEQLNVATIKFKNSFVYVQRIMNKELRQFRNFYRVYIDNIVVFS